MAGNLTLAIIKPHAYLEKKLGKIITEVEANGFGVLAVKTLQLTETGAMEFYKEHEGKDFFTYLVKTMSGGPIAVMILAKSNCVEEWRTLIGATDPAEAAEGTLRNKYGNHKDKTLNAVHGSATDHDALREINFFFQRELMLASEVDAANNKPPVS